MSLAAAVQADMTAHNRAARQCTACKAITAFTPADLTEYHQLRADDEVPLSSLARAMGIRPPALRGHISAGHHEPR